MDSAISSRFIERGKQAHPLLRLVVIIAAGLGYVGVYLALSRSATGGLVALAAIPVLLAGWLFGYRGGWLAFVVFFFINPVLIARSAGAPIFWDAFLRRGNIAGNIVLVLVGTGAAWLSRLHGSLVQEIRAKESARLVLAESERQYRTLFENAPIGLGVTDDRGGLLAFNDEMLRPGGYTPEDIRSLGSVDRLYADAEARSDILQELIQTGEVREREVRFLRKDGGTYFGRLSVIPIQYGGQAGRLAIVRDVTEELEAREMLLKSRRRFQSLLENSRDVITLIDSAGTILEETIGVEAVLGYSPAERVGTPIWGPIHPDDLEYTNGVVREVLAAPGNIRSTNMRCRHKDGSWRWLEATGTNLLDDPDVAAVVINYRDISPMVEVTRNVRERESFLSLLNEITRIALAATDFKPSLQILVDSLTLLFRSDACYLTFWDQDLEEPFPIAASGPLQDSYPSISMRPDERTFTDAILERGAAILVENVFKTDLVSPSVVENFPETALLGLPMLAGERKIGAILVTYNDPLALMETDVRRAEHVAAQIALAINKIQLLAETRRRAEQMETLYELSQSLNERQDLPWLLTRISENACNLLEANAGALYLYEPGEEELVIAVSTADFVPLGARLKIWEGMAGRVFSSRKAMSVEDYRIWADRAEQYEGMPFRAVVEVPLIYAGEALGVLAVYQVGDNRRVFSRADEHLLSLFASQAAGAVHNARLYEDLELSNIELSRAYETTLEGWARALDLRDSQTEGHAKRVTEMTLRLAKKMGIDDERLVHIQRGALLHDIGKMSIPDEILLKEGPLDEEEWEIMRMHPVYAYEFIGPVEFLRPALDIPYSHHERWDGSGYPRGLKGEEIPIAARIFAVVDSWDALRSDRPYRGAWPDEDILKLLKEKAGSHFDPEVVEAFLAFLAEMETGPEAQPPPD